MYVVVFVFFSGKTSRWSLVSEQQTPRKGSRTPYQLRRRRPLADGWFLKSGLKSTSRPSDKRPQPEMEEPPPRVGFSLASSLCDFMSGPNKAGGSPSAPVPAFGPRQTVPRPVPDSPSKALFYWRNSNAFTAVLLVSIYRLSRLRRPNRCV